METWHCVSVSAETDESQEYDGELSYTALLAFFELTFELNLFFQVEIFETSMYVGSRNGLNCQEYCIKIHQ